MTSKIPAELMRFVLTSPPERYRGDGNESAVGFIPFVVTSKYSTELIDITEVTLHNVSPFV